MRFQLTHAKVFVCGSVSFFLGTALGSVWTVTHVWVPAFFTLVVFVAALSSLKRLWKLAFVAVCLLCAMGGFWRAQAESTRTSVFAQEFGQKIELVGQVVEPPDLRQGTQLLLVRPEGGQELVQVTLPLTRELFYGDLVRLTGKVQQPENFSDFDYVNYLKARKIRSLMRYPKVRVLSSGHGNVVVEAAIAVQRYVVEQFEKWLPRDQAALASGMVLGAKRELSSEWQEKFRATGLSHIVVASGYNIAVVASLVSFAFVRLGRKKNLLAIFLAVGFYCLMAGLSAAVLRAAVMGLLAPLAQVVGRPYSPAPSLCLAGLVLLFGSPLLLVYDAGLQLSFLATMGILYGLPAFFQTTSLPKNFVTNNVAVSFCAFVATLPLIMFQFGQISTVSLLANVLVAPAVAYVWGVAALIAVPLVAGGAALIASGLLAYILFLTNYFAQFSWAVKSVSMGLWPMLATYTALAVVVWRTRAQSEAFQTPEKLLN